jgi:predicted kinase
MRGTSSGCLIIVCGLSGSGKTTLAKRLEQERSAIRLSPDEWMDALSINLWDSAKRDQIEALQWKLAQDVLRVGQTAIIEWGTWGRSERDALRLGARALGAAVELHYLSASADLLFQRVERRAVEDPPITRDDIDRWFEAFQAPDADEMALYDVAALRQQ